MAYGTVTGVEALVPGTGALGGGSLPTEAQVEAWLDQGAAVINRVLSSAGYSTPILATATAYPELTALNELYAAAYVIMARGLDSVAGENENRSAAWMQMFHDRLAGVAGSPLPGVPVLPAVNASGGRLRFTPVKRVDGYSRIYDDVDVDA